MLKFHHFALEVSDFEKVSEFYQNILGFSEGERIHIEGEQCVLLKLGSVRLELIHNRYASDAPEQVHICFETDCLAEIKAKMEKEGLAPTEGPYYLKNGWKTIFYTGLANEIIEFLER